jgi:hypothetical protein
MVEDCVVRSLQVFCEASLHRGVLTESYRMPGHAYVNHIYVISQCQFIDMPSKTGRHVVGRYHWQSFPPTIHMYYRVENE